MTSQVSPKPLTSAEMYQAMMSPSCSAEVLGQVKARQNEVRIPARLRQINDLPPDLAVKELIRVCRDQMDKNPNRLQIQL